MTINAFIKHLVVLALLIGMFLNNNTTCNDPQRFHFNFITYVPELTLKEKYLKKAEDILNLFTSEKRLILIIVWKRQQISTPTNFSEQAKYSLHS